MKIKDLLNNRVSYQVIVTFDLEGADTSAYKKLRNELGNELQLETTIYKSIEDGGKERPLPYNTLAALWRKDSNESSTRDFFESKIINVMKRHKLRGKYLILVAQNWAVGADAF